MKRSETILSYLKEIKEELLGEGIVALALFGCFARDDETVYNYIDIAIAKEKDHLKKCSTWHYFDEVSTMKASIMKDIVYVE